MLSVALLLISSEIEFFAIGRVPDGYTCDVSEMLTSSPPQYRCWKGRETPKCPENMYCGNWKDKFLYFDSKAEYIFDGHHIYIKEK